MPRKWKRAKPPGRIRAAGPNIKAFRLGAGATVAINAAKSEGEMPSFEGCLYTGASMTLGGFWDPVIIDLEGVMTKAQTRPVLRQHDPNLIVGHTTEIRCDKHGIHVSGKFSGEKHNVDSVVVPAKNGFQWEMSIGCDPHKTERLEAGKEAKINGRTVTGPMLIVRETEVGEASFVPIGADGDTSAKVAASKGTGFMWKQALQAFVADQIAAKKKATYTQAEIDDMDEAGAKCALAKAMSDDDDDDKKKKDAAAKQPVQAAFDAQAAMTAHRQNMVQEHVRMTSILQACATRGVTTIELEEAGVKKTVNLAAHAIENGWDLDKVTMRAELFKLTKERDEATKHVGVPGGLGYSISNPQVTDAVLEAAVFQAGHQNFQLWDQEFYSNDGTGQNGRIKRRVSAKEERRITAELKGRYTEQVQQTAHTAFKGRVGLQQVLCMMAAQHGYRGRDSITSFEEWGAVSQCLARGATQIQADGGSTVNIANVLANVQNKYMLQGYLTVDQAFNDICGVIPVKDFKPTKSIALFGDSEFQDIGPNAEIPHGTLTDQAFANQASMRARMFTLPLQDIINDDLNMLGQVPMILGRGWGLKINRLVWTLLLTPGNGDDGNAFFRTTSSTVPNAQYNANKGSGAGSALSSDSMKTAYNLFKKQIDPVGNPLGAEPEIVLVPSELDQTLWELLNSQFIIMAGLASTSSASKQPSANRWQGKFNPVVTPYLSGSFANASTTGWYMLASPTIWPVIQLAALNGQMVPTVQTAGQDFQFNMLGISMRGFGGVGVGVQNFRGGVFMPGA